MTPSAPSAIDRTHHARILIRGTNWIGDAVMTMPAVQRLRELEPDAHLALLCPAKLHDLWRHNIHLNEIIPFDDQPNLRQLREKYFHVAIIFPNSFRSAYECWRAGIPQRIGFAGHWRRHLLTTVVEEPPAEQVVYRDITVAGKTFQRKVFPTVRHQAHRYLDLIARLGGNHDIVYPKIWVAPGEIPALSKFVREGSRPFFGLIAGAEYGPAKRWFPDRFAEVAARVSAEVPCRWLLLGGPGDVAIAGQIEDQLRATLGDDRAVVNVAGKTTLLELCELVKCCRLVLTNDTGPMHITSAIGTPLVAIFGSTSAALTGPLGPHAVIVKADVECTPCFFRECPIDFRCMKSITVERVTAAVLKLWQTVEKEHHRG
jgi:heptosyltransferase-2